MNKLVANTRSIIHKHPRFFYFIVSLSCNDTIRTPVDRLAYNLHVATDCRKKCVFGKYLTLCFFGFWKKNEKNETSWLRWKFNVPSRQKFYLFQAVDRYTQFLVEIGWSHIMIFWILQNLWILWKWWLRLK